MNAANTLKKLGIEHTFNYIYKDPDKNMSKLMDWADKFSKGGFPSQRKTIREAIENPEHLYYSYIRKIFTDVDPNVAKTLAVNFFINATLVGWSKEKARCLHVHLYRWRTACTKKRPDQSLRKAF